MAEGNYGLESYKEGNQYGRAILDALYKLAGMSFTLNSALLTAFGKGDGSFSSL